MTTSTAAIAEHVGDAASAVVAIVRKALVVVRSRDGFGAGTLVITASSTGLVLTSAHLLGSRTSRVTFADGRTSEAEVLALDRELDLAALRVEALASSPALDAIPLGDSRAMVPGELVLALGHPGGLAAAVTAGVLLGVGDDWPGLPAGGRDWLVANLRLRPGHSGGPVVDTEGRLVGVNAVMAGPDLGMAVPSHTAAAFLREWLA